MAPGAVSLMRFGGILGSEEIIEAGFQANAFLNKPTLHTHNRYGARIDEVRFHPSYHKVHELSMKEGLHSSQWLNPGAGAHVSTSSQNFMMSQTECGHLCPVTMTMAAIPTLKHQPDIYEKWAHKVMALDYDPRNVHHDQKAAVTIGMAMTEKQGGSDVPGQQHQSLTAKGEAGPGKEYLITGHKYFVSAPMCDAFLMLAYSPGGVLLPGSRTRWRDDGTKNHSADSAVKEQDGQCLQCLQRNGAAWCARLDDW